MDNDDNTRPAKPSEHGAVRKHDQVGVTDEPDQASHDRYFDDAGNKVSDVEFVGVRAPDADPDDGVRARDRDQGRRRR
jgi:hypothetical protein